MKKCVNMYHTQLGYYELFNRYRQQDVFICANRLNSYFNIIKNGRYVAEITIVISDKSFNESYPIKIKHNEFLGEGIRCNIMGEPSGVVGETVKHFVEKLKLKLDKTYYVGVEI